MNRRLTVAAVLAVGAALRFWNIDAGLPSRISVDEPVITDHAIRMMRTGDFNPRFWDYPGLYIYLQMVVGCLRFITGAMSGLWRSLDQFHAEHLFLWMRMLNAAIGTLTVALVYRAGLRWGYWVALTAMAIFAVWPNHVRESHFALTDVPVTFLTVVALLLSFRAHDTGRWRWFFASGAIVGLAAATKYNGVYTLLLPLLAAGTTKAPAASRVGRGAVAIAASAFGFLLGSPYALLDLPGFLNGFGKLSTYYQARPLSEGASIYIGHLRVASGQIGILTIAAGILWGTVRAIRDKDIGSWALIAIFPLTYLVSVATKQLIFARYLLPMIPFLCLIMALVLVDGVTWTWRLHRPRWLRVSIVAVGLPLVLFPVVRAGVQWPTLWGRPTTQDVAYERIRELIPTGSGVVVERSALRLPETLYRQLDVPAMPIRTPEHYMAHGFNYLVASSTAFSPVLKQPSEHAREYEAYQRVFNNPGHCLDAIQPTAALTGPEVIICRLDAPLQ